MKWLLAFSMPILVLYFFSSCSSIDVGKETDKGIRLFKADSFEASIEVLTKVLQTDKNCTDCFLYRAFSYKELEEYYKALKDLKAITVLNPKASYAYANIGNIYYEMEDYEKALESYKKALEVKPDFTLMYNTISHMLFTTGQKDEGCEYYQKAMKTGHTDFNPDILQYCGNN